MGIFYSNFNGKIWSFPMKIYDGVRNPDISIDNSGFLHLAMEVFMPGPDKNVSIYYSRSTNSIY